jgi:hypothetical protein
MKENKLIAEFMGNEYGDYNTPHYHCNWNELMPVVENIEDEGYSFERNKQEEGDWQCLIVKGYDIIYQTFADCSREATYKAVVEFIKQHNK